jgi:hypothetical protein
MKAAAITASKLRADIYNILDQVIETGRPVEIERKDATVRIVLVKKAPSPKGSKLERLKSVQVPDLWIGDPDDIFRMDWLEGWRKK